MGTKATCELTVQFNVSLALKNEIYRIALERGPLRAFILKVLKDCAITVSDYDSAGRRKVGGQ